MFEQFALPVFAGLLAALGSYIALFNLGSLNKRFKSDKKVSSRSALTLIITLISSYFTTFLLTSSEAISLAIATLSAALPFLIGRGRNLKKQREREVAWPEAIDSLVSALQAGISISEALTQLALHGPKVLRPSFAQIQSDLLSLGNFEQVLLKEKRRLDSAISDQVFETLIISKDFGGRDANNALRLLAEFVREDIAVSEEIRTKFGWIRNSALLATAAPWLLLILLSTQDSTVEIYSTPSGALVLSLGVVMTATAYIWMEKVGSLPAAPRALR
ncbi:MAG: type II secretion system F family protein [Candidatus Nanopelagicaceae bacterium]|nr:type II secretion system F family protein [Candidatus Nanopelagicaceae bacterium]